MEEKVENYRSGKRRRGIPIFARVKRSRLSPKSTSNKTNIGEISEEEYLPWPQAYVDYNKLMRGVDGNAHLRALLHPPITGFKYWWCLWLFLLDVAMVNAYILYKMKYPKVDITRKAWHRKIALTLMRNQVGRVIQAPKYHTNFQPTVRLLEHTRAHFTERNYCHPCRVYKRSSSKSDRQPLQEVCGNQERQRGTRTVYGCSAKACQGYRICRTSRCWIDHHELINEVIR